MSGSVLFLSRCSWQFASNRMMHYRPQLMWSVDLMFTQKRCCSSSTTFPGSQTHFGVHKVPMWWSNFSITFSYAAPVVLDKFLYLFKHILNTSKLLLLYSGVFLLKNISIDLYYTFLFLHFSETFKSATTAA